MPRRLRVLVLGALLGIALFAITGPTEASETPAGLELRVVASLAPGSGVRTVPARVVVTTADGEESATPLRVPGEAKVPLPEGKSTVRLVAAGFWSRSAPAVPGEVRLRLHPAARLEGAVSAPGGAPPESLRVFYDGPNLLAPVVLACPVDRRGQYMCHGPAGRFDLQVRSHGFAPHFLWDVELPVRDVRRLAPIALRPGASVSGFVRRSDGEPPREKATVSLRPQVLGESGSRDRETGKTLSVLEREARPGAHGDFVFADVPPGRYDLEAVEPGWTPGRVEGIEVREGSETHLAKPVEIAEPVALQVQLSPALAPSGKRWRLKVFGQRVLRLKDAVTQTCDELGYTEFAALPEDTYMLVAEDPGNGQPFGTREVEVAAPLAFVTWDLPLVEIEGRVRLGRKAIPAQVVFGPTSMSSRSFEADEDGLFAGVLPEAGEWDVQVENREYGVFRWLRGVEVPAPSKPGDVAEVRLDLPATEIGGTVVDEEYRPIRAQVIVQPLAERDRATAGWSEGDGAFVFRGLPPGAVELFATVEEDRTSPVTRVDLPPDATIGPIQLRVERKRTLHGSVHRPDGPVRGARITLRGVGSPLYTSTTATATSDARGVFSLEVPVGLRQAQLQVRAPGHPLTVRRAALGETLDLFLEPVWGTAEVDWAPELNERLFMVKDGASWSFSQFVSWAMAHPGEGEALSGRTRIPRLEPGTWHVCAPVPGTVEWLHLVSFGLPGASCKTLDVTAWGMATAAMEAETDE